MPRGKETSEISRHLWNYHGRTHSTGTKMQRELYHEELHATAEPGTIGHEHGQNGEFRVFCACGHFHDCTVLAPEED